MDNLIVCNQRRVSDFLGFKVNDEDILNIPKCKDFITKYQSFFKNVSISNFRNFYKETGLKLTIIYTQKTSNKMISFNALGSSIDKIFKKDIYNHDILAINKVDSIEIKNECIIIDGKKMYGLNSNIDMSIHEKQYKKIRYELCFAKSIDEKKKIIKENYEQNVFLKKGIKQIYLGSFGNLYVLYEDGTLYQDNEIYAKNVSTIWETNSYVSFLIFEDYSLEYLSNSNECYHNVKYDKIIYNDNYIGLLKDKELEVISILEESDSNYHAFFSNVDDISLGSNEMEIALETNGNKIFYRTTSFVEEYK